MTEKKSPHNFWLWKAAEIVAKSDDGLQESQLLLLKGLQMDLLAERHKTHSLWALMLGQQLGGRWGLQEGPESSGFGSRSVKTDRSHCFFCYNHPACACGWASYESPSTWLKQLPFPADSLRPHSTQLVGQPKLLLVFFIQLPVLAHAADFSKIFWSFTAPSNLGLAHTFCRAAKAWH